LFPASIHVFDTDLARFTTDEMIWNYAAANELTIVTADSDFLDLAESRGSPESTSLANSSPTALSYRPDLFRPFLRCRCIGGAFCGPSFLRRRNNSLPAFLAQVSLLTPPPFAARGRPFFRCTRASDFT
jgi:uncharacterized protein DUF5615